MFSVTKEQIRIKKFRKYIRFNNRPSSMLPYNVLFQSEASDYPLAHLP